MKLKISLLVIIATLSTLWFISCEKQGGAPESEILVYVVYSDKTEFVQEGDTLLCCHDILIDIRQSKNMYSRETRYLCDNDSMALSQNTVVGVDTIMRQKEGILTITSTIKNSDGESDTKTKNYYVR